VRKAIGRGRVAIDRERERERERLMAATWREKFFFAESENKIILEDKTPSLGDGK